MLLHPSVIAWAARIHANTSAAMRYHGRFFAAPRDKRAEGGGREPGVSDIACGIARMAPEALGFAARSCYFCLGFSASRRELEMRSSCSIALAALVVLASPLAHSKPPAAAAPAGPAFTM